MTTPQSLWERLDTALVNAFTAEMGEDGDYTTDVLAAIGVSETWDPDKGPYPRLILWSTVARPEIGSHGGGGKTHVTTTIPYMAVALAQGSSYAAARATSQTLFARMIAVLASGAAILAAAQAADPTSPERAVKLSFERGLGGSGIEIRGRQGSNTGVWRGLAVVAFTVETFV